MKFTIAKSDLLKSASAVQGVIANKPALPVLASVLLEVKDDLLNLSGTDLMVSVRSTIPVQMERAGSLALPARQFFQLIRELPLGQIELASSDSNITIRSGNSSFRLHGVASEEFPPLTQGSSATECVLPAVQFREALLRTSFAAAREDHRQVLNSVSLQSDGEKLTCIGTDGKRLAKMDCPVKVSAGSYIVPLKAVEELIKILEGGSEVGLRLNHDAISLQTTQLQMTSKLLVGSYPDVSQVIPVPGVGISLLREELISLLKQVSLFTSEASSAVLFSFSQGRLELEAKSSDIGEGRVSMTIDYSGEEMNISFHPGYLIDILRHSRDREISIHLGGQSSPALITDSSLAQSVLMPMRSQ